MNRQNNLPKVPERTFRSSELRNPQRYPPWFLQQSTWVENPTHSDSALYNLPLNLRIQGPLNHEALDKTLTEIVRRHEILRSSFLLAEGQLVQKICAPVPLRTTVVDLGKTEVGKRLQQAVEIVKEETLKPFDLSSSPILRGKLLRLSDDDHILALASHHLVFDDWSIGIFGREFSTLYQAFAAGEPSRLPELTFNYSDFLRWQDDFLQGQALQSRLSFWRERLRGATDFHHLETDYTRPATRSHRGSWQSESLSPELSGALRTLSQREGASIFMTLVTAFQALLHRYSGDGDIGLGICAANRGHLGVENLIGRFANDLVLRTDLSDNPTFRKLLSRVRRAALESYAYQDLPFGTLVQDLAPVRDPSRNSLFQVMFILQDAPKNEWNVPGFMVDWFHVELGTARYDLNVWLKAKERIEIGFEYNADLFTPCSMQRMLEGYRTTLENFVANSDTPVANLPLARKAEEGIELKSLASTVEFVGPRDPLEVQLVELWEHAFEVKPFGIRDNLFELGGGSLLAARLCRRIEKSLGTKLSLATFFEVPTVEQLAAALRSSQPSERTVRVVPLQERGSRPPFFCPCINIGAGPIFLPLTKHLGSDQPFLGLVPEETLMSQLPTPYTMEDIAHHLIVAIRHRQPRGPYFLGGFCGDGVLAFETARQLRAQGEDVVLLALFEAQTPDRYQEFQAKRTQVRSIFGRLSFHQLGRHLARLWQSDMEKLPGYVRTRMRELIQDLNKIIWQVSLDWNLRTNHGRLSDARQMLFVAEKSYRPRPYGGNVAVFRCDAYRATIYNDRDGGWREFVKGSLEVHEIPGDHLGILNEPNVQSLAGKLTGCLGKAQQRGAVTNCQSSREPGLPIGVTVDHRI